MIDTRGKTMKEFTVRAYYTISVEMKIQAEDEEQAIDIAQGCDRAIGTEWTGNSVFVRESVLDDAVKEMTVCADGMLRNFECD